MTHWETIPSIFNFKIHLEALLSLVLDVVSGPGLSSGLPLRLCPVTSASRGRDQEFCRSRRQRDDARRRPRDDGRGVTVSKERSGALLSKSQGGPSGLRGHSCFPVVLASSLSPPGTPLPGQARPRVVLPRGLTGTRRPPAARRPAALSVRLGPVERGAKSDARRLGSAERRAGLRRRVSGMPMPPRQGSAAPATP